jgi:hypothetical protein
MKALNALKVGRLKVEGWKTRRAACLGCGVDRRGKILTAGDRDLGPWRLPGERGTRNTEHGTPAALLFLAALVWAGLCFGMCLLAAGRIAAAQAGTEAGLEAMAADLEDVRAARLRMEATCPK